MAMSRKIEVEVAEAFGRTIVKGNIPEIHPVRCLGADIASTFARNSDQTYSTSWTELRRWCVRAIASGTVLA